jgi:transposase InsO family protein
MEGWRVPDIKQMLQRLGQQKSRYFAVMDLTSGYHQAPLCKESWKYTAFITYMGVYEWTRVPMGLKGAPSYFQHQIACTVLGRLMYKICELYIDDIIVHAKTLRELLMNLREVFVRFRKYRIYLNPDKCKFGVTSVEYVGHTIDESGMSFSAEKRNEVLDIPPPKYGKELRSFVGLASYFRDHVNNLATLLKPLHDMIENYQKTKKLVWTETSQVAFATVKEAIQKCPKLFFLDENTTRYPIILYTDASDYGIGGAVFQLMEGKELPIAFMSKTLSAQECRWSTIEKECYAIVYSLRKFEYLLQGRTFTIRTDHENLKYLGDPPSPKVRRWKLAMQEHDFFIEHIPGETNVVADGFSRLLPIEKENVFAMIEAVPINAKQYSVLQDYHNCVTGHHGVERMLQKLLTDKHSWPRMRAHVKKFVKECPACQKMRQVNTQIFTHPFSLSTTRPMEELHIDTLSVGVADSYGNEHILVVIDACSRWVELYPLPDLSAASAAEKLLEQFGRFGQPFIIRSDNGTQFCNDIISELLRMAEITHVRTTPYSHEENGLVERANKEVLRHLRAVMFDKNIHSEWEKARPFVQRILNTEPSSITKVRPCEILLGNAVDLDRHIYRESVQDEYTVPLSKWIGTSLRLQQKVLEVLVASIHAIDAEREANADARRTEFAIGTKVLCANPQDGLGNTHMVHKLKTPLKGPLTVLRRQGDQYVLLNHASRKEETVHISRLRPFYYDETRVDPNEVALKDRGMYLIEKVLDHAGNVNRKSQLTFLVRWEGYDESTDSWLPWKELIHNSRLHKYLHDHHLEKLIPKEHRKENYD